MKKIITAINIIIAIYFFILANLFFWLSLLSFPKLMGTSFPFQLHINIIFAIFLMSGSVVFFIRTKRKYLYGIIVFTIIWAEISFFLTKIFGETDSLLTVLFLGIPFGIPLVIIFFTRYFDRRLSK